jgi:acyl-CoA thioester hydrolase
MHEKHIEIRWSDVDSYDHVNNAVYLTYLEEVRDEWYEQTVEAAGGGAFVLVRVAIDFRKELTLADAFVVAKCAPVKLGRSSVTTREEIWSGSGGFLAAEAESVMVAHDPASRKSRPLTDVERVAVERALHAEEAPSGRS